jgi:molecular chaperone IbpA
MNISLKPLNYLANTPMGYEKIFDDLDRVVKSSLQKANLDAYPPHNLVKLNETDYIIEVAVAGFSQDEVTITFENGNVTITGDRKEKHSEEVEYNYRGIATRNFTKTIVLADTFEVRGATFENGILTIGLENRIQDVARAQKVPISKKSLDNFYPKLNQAKA